MKKLTAEAENYKKYHTPGCPNYVKRPKNAVFYNAGSTTLHELSKAVGALMLQKYGDVKFDKNVLYNLRTLSDCIDMTCEGMSGKADFLTECVPNTETNRRIDLLRLKDEVRYEFESNPKVLKKGDNTITIYIIEN